MYFSQKKQQSFRRIDPWWGFFLWNGRLHSLMNWRMLCRGADGTGVQRHSFVCRTTASLR
jgi:hypothetical protein